MCLRCIYRVAATRNSRGAVIISRYNAPPHPLPSLQRTDRKVLAMSLNPPRPVSNFGRLASQKKIRNHFSYICRALRLTKCECSRWPACVCIFFFVFISQSNRVYNACVCVVWEWICAIAHHHRRHHKPRPHESNSIFVSSRV